MSHICVPSEVNPLASNSHLNDITSRFIQLRSTSTSPDTILNATLPPLWLEASEETRRLLIQLSDLIKKLELVQQESLLDVFESNLALGSQIEQFTREVVMTFKRCQQSLKDIYPLFAKPGTPELVFCENARKVYNLWLERLSMQFKTLQKNYIAKIGKGERSSAGKFTHPPPVPINLPGTLPQKAQKQGVGSMPTLKSEMIGDLQVDKAWSYTAQDLDSIRNLRLAEIVSSLQDIKDITMQIASIAIIQGTMLDRIDYNIMVSAEQTELAAKALKKRVDDELFALMVIRNMLILITFLTVLIVFKLTRGDIKRHVHIITNVMSNKLMSLEAGWKAHGSHL